MTDLAELVRNFEQARSTGESITLSPDDLSLMLQFASLIGEPARAVPEPVEAPQPEDRLASLVSIDEVASMIRVGLKTIWRLRKNDPTFPKPIRTSARRKQFLRSEVEDWLFSRRG